MLSTLRCQQRATLTQLSQRCVTKSVSTFSRRYRASKTVNLSHLTEALNASIVSSISKCQNRSFSHYYRRHKSTLFEGSRRIPDRRRHEPTSIAIDARHLLSSSHKRSFSASYRHHHVSLLSRLSKIFFPALLPPKETTQAKYRSKSVPEILASRSFSHAYRERQLAHIKAYLPPNPFSGQGRRSASSVPVFSDAARVDSAGTTVRDRRIWRLRLLAASITSLLALGFVVQQQDVQMHPALSETQYIPWEIVSAEQISPTTSIFTLKTASPQGVASLPLITSVSIKEPNANIQRPYTVLSSTGDTIQILVRRYADGDLSRYIHARKMNSTLELKQTTTATLPSSNKYLFVVGGTGIAPAFQCIERFASMPLEERPIVDILYASLSDEEVYLRSQLDALQEASQGTVRVTYFVDTQSVIDATVMKHYSEEHEDIVKVVCGSDGFISYIAGPKPEVGQGAIGGLMAEVGMTTNVLKL